MQGRVREWRWECGEMEKRVKEVRSEEVRLRGALEQREREAIAHLREVSWKYVSKSGFLQIENRSKCVFIVFTFFMSSAYDLMTSSIFFTQSCLTFSDLTT